MSVRQDSTLLGWFLFVCSCYCSMFLLFSCIKFLLYSSLLSDIISLYHHPSYKLPFFCPFLCFDFLILFSVQSVSYFSGGCSFRANRMLLCHAVCLKPWFYCCRTKLNLMWLLGCYLQFISLSAALVKRTLSRYFFFIIFQIIFFTVYNNPLKARNLNLSLPRSSPSYIHTGLLL